MVLMQAQRLLCQKLELKGRILLSDEGINGTVAGTAEQIAEYRRQTEAVPEFADMEWKVSYADQQVFPKLKIKVRDEIVSLGVKKTGQDVSLSNTAHYIEPVELKALYDSNEQFLIVDARNSYEAEIGKFKNAVTPPIENFRDLPAFIETVKAPKDTPVVTYCTGGVRCEKASALLRERGFTNVRQLHGGIHEYGQQAGGKYFEGEMFVFDQRLHVTVNSENPSVISHCRYCQTLVTEYVDCADAACGELFICCERCQKKYSGRCVFHSAGISDKS